VQLVALKVAAARKAFGSPFSAARQIDSWVGNCPNAGFANDPPIVRRRVAKCAATTKTSWLSRASPSPRSRQLRERRHRASFPPRPPPQPRDAHDATRRATPRSDRDRAAPPPDAMPSFAETRSRDEATRLYEKLMTDAARIRDPRLRRTCEEAVESARATTLAVLADADDATRALHAAEHAREAAAVELRAIRRERAALDRAKARAEAESRARRKQLVRARASTRWRRAPRTPLEVLLAESAAPGKKR